MEKRQTLVVKFGTAVLTRYGKIRQDVLGEFAGQVVRTMEEREPVFVVLVSSGAIQMGRQCLRANGGPNSKIDDKKLLAATGQHHLMNAWRETFASYGREVAQVLLTHANWENEHERKSVGELLQSCKDTGIVPIVNENDPVSDIEIHLMERKISENDILAACVANLVGAEGTLFLTKSGGIRAYEESAKGRIVREINVRDLGLVDVGQGTASGRGGMARKFDAIRMCVEENSAMRVAVAGRQKDAIVRFAKGLPVGTRILTETK